jgi:glycosyltransferase involved in cell wall biosynthesis
MTPGAHSGDLHFDFEPRFDEAAVRCPIPGLFLMTDSFQTGGSERQFAALAGALDPGAFQVHLGCIQRRGVFLEGAGPVHEFPLKGSLYGLQSVRTRLRLAQYLRRRRIAVAHAFDFYTNLTLIPAARMAGVPVIIGSHRQLGDLLTRQKLRVQAAAFELCDAVVCNSRAAADGLIAHGLRRSRVVVIGNGLPPTAFAETLPSIPRRTDTLRVGIIARMNTRSKNHDVFLRAATRLRTLFPNLECLLVGDGPLRGELEHQAKTLGLMDNVVFLGERQDIPAVLASLDVSVIPSSSESLSNTILESMAAGVPVIASRVGGNPELVTSDRGILVSPGEDEALAHSIGRLLRNPRMRLDLSRNAKQFVQNNFTLESMRTRYEQLYAELLEKKNWRTSGSRSAPALQSHGERIRVALVAASSHYIGGQSVQAELLLRNWQDDPEIKATFIPIDSKLPGFLTWAKLIPFLRTLIREPIYLASLWRGLRDVEIVHIFSASHWSFVLAPLPAWLIARIRGAKTVIHYHSGEARHHLRRFRSAIPVLQGADRVVVPSEYLVEVFREFKVKTCVVPNAVELTQFAFRERNPLRSHLLCTRGFHPYYCPQDVVWAFAEIQRQFSEARIDLLGTGSLEPQVRKLVEDMKLSRVNFVGAVPHHTIARFYDAADIFVNASNLDNMPVSILEAFSSGIPVVTTAPEGMAHLVEHERTGLLSKPGDPAALAENVIRLLREPKLASRLATNAYEEVQRCSWKLVRQQWLEVYNSLDSGCGVSAADFVIPHAKQPEKFLRPAATSEDILCKTLNCAQ